MEKIFLISQSEVQKGHIEQALNLDRISYDDTYHLSLNTCLSYFDKNNQIYIMALDETKTTVLGYINFSPITEEMYQKIKSGQTIDTVIESSDIVRYVDDVDCWGYMSSIVVHPDHRNRGIAKQMLMLLQKQICELAMYHNIFFNSIVADAVSDLGEYILTEIGYEKIKTSNHDTKIMELNLFNENTVETEYNKEMIAIYKRRGK
ncbi:MAG: GNAT family N-acetyltransferase [Clostridia bacterium]|nr:GNAT family N-acetyltransferase [Clostridia bacterium]